MVRAGQLVLVAGALVALAPAAGLADRPLVAYEVTGDGIAAPLGGLVGDPARGRAITADRRVGLCILCPSGPFPEEPLQGTLAPDLAGAGARATVPQLRLRMVDASRLNRETIMPSYYRTDGLVSVAERYRGQPILSAQQIEDVVAYLATLKE